MNCDNRPIGVFDSGIGGLTVLKTLAQRFPSENFLYVGDTARLPYGSKSGSTIRKYSEQIMNYLLKQNVKAIVIACNSASSQVPESKYHETPVYNVILPGAKKALQSSLDHKIGVLGTRATIQSSAYKTKILEMNPNAEVFGVACPLFVPLAEEGMSEDPITNLIAYRYLQPLLEKNVDVIIMGCTHYPILKPALEKVVMKKVELVDSGEAISDWMSEDIQSKIIRVADSHQKRILQVQTTDSSEHFHKLAEKILSPFEAQYSVIDL